MAGKWDDDRRQKQREDIKKTKPGQYVGRKNGKHFDGSALAAALIGLPKVRSW